MASLTLGCGGIIGFVPAEGLATEIPPDTELPTSPPSEQQPADSTPTPPPEPTATPGPPPTPTETPPPTPTRYLLQSMSMCPPKSVKDDNKECCPYGYGVDENGFCAFNPNNVLPEDTPLPTPRHGLLIVFVLPLVCLGIPWIIAELNIVRYVQPKGIDLSMVRIKAQDGLFIDAIISLTARRTLTLASSRMSWSRVQEFVEKPLEQELIHEALSYPSIDELELSLKTIAEDFNTLPIIKELANDFGVEVVRFNIEARYSQETMDAINRKAEASAGGTAYLAYAQAAHLDPDSRESRELYRVYQETTGRVDAARNLGGGLTSLAEVFTPKSGSESSEDDSGS